MNSWTETITILAEAAPVEALRSQTHSGRESIRSWLFDCTLLGPPGALLGYLAVLSATNHETQLEAESMIPAIEYGGPFMRYMLYGQDLPVLPSDAQEWFSHPDLHEYPD